MTAQTSARGREPLVSVVLAVNGVEHYLPACLDSVLGQPGAHGEVEVVAVDDASTDASGAILDARAAVDPRVRVVHLAERAGPGPARRAGLAAATGTYVWFVDPDDLVVGDCLAGLSAQLDRIRPDVMLLDYRILHPSGRTTPSPGADLLAGQRPVVTLAQRPGLINRTMTSWSKVFRRSFLLGLGDVFPAGIHEDVPLTCAALLAAQHIGLSDRVCYLYRRRAGSFLATVSMAHFSIFSAYEHVFAGLAAGSGPDACPPPVQAAVFARAVEHYTTVLASGLVPRHARRSYFARMAADFQRYRPPGYRRPRGLRGVKTALVEHDAYWAYWLLAPLNAARVLAQRLGREA